MSKRRLARLRRRMAEAGLDAFIVSSLTNVRYLTGFTGTNGMCVVRNDDALFVTDPRYVQQARQEVAGIRRVVTPGTMMEAAVEEGAFRGCRTIGFESHVVTYTQYRSMKKLIGGATFESTANLVESIAVVKEKKELDAIREAARISDRVFADVLKSITAGVTELEISAEISWLHKRYGAEKDAFDPIIASGERGAYPHARASSKKIRNHELVTLDFGCTVDGYHSDLTRTVAVGTPNQRARRMYAVVLEAQAAAVNTVREGVSTRALDAVARDSITAAGFGRYFQHSLGHGLGLRVHEAPRVSAMSNETLLAGSVITIEPGVYIPHFGGVRIEDDVVVTETGCEVLTKSSKQLIIL
jgi:Xaa-Pro aminopeptidase